MALKTTDPTTGEDKYSPAWIIGLALVLALVGGSFIYFVVVKPKTMRQKQTVATIDRQRTERAVRSPEVPSAVDAREKDAAYLNSVSTLLDPEQRQAQQIEVPEVSSQSNTDSRFARELNSERLQRLGAGVETSGDDYMPNRFVAPAAGSAAAKASPEGVGLNGRGRVIDTTPTLANRGNSPERPNPSTGIIQPLTWGTEPPGETSGAATAPVARPTLGLSPNGLMTSNMPMGFDGSAPASESRMKISTNSVPTGTRLNVVLLNNVISSSIKQRVWAITTQELIFRRQVQLPAGVLLGGWQSGSPVREQLDVMFDLVVFPDGTELPISGFGVNAYNPMYPGLEGMRGLVDVYREPPLWTQFLPVLMDFVAGYTDVTMSDQTIIQGDNSRTNPNQRVQVNKAVNAGMEAMKAKVVTYLERYTPYVHLRKGMSFQIELESTVDFSLRTLGARSYDEVVAEVRAQNTRVAPQVSSPMVSAPDYLGLPATTTADGLREQLAKAVAIQAALQPR